MHDTAQDWNETAVRQAMDECDNVPYLMIGSLGLGAVALAFTNYLVAGALTLGGVALSQKKQNNAIARAEFAIKHNGSAVAARGDELKEYSDAFGKESAAEQLLHAAQKGIPLNRDGWNLLEDHYGDSLDEILENPQTAKTTGHRWFEPQQLPVNGQDQASPVSGESKEPRDIAGLMHFFRFQNSLIWGGQGSGKTSLTKAIAADKLKHGQQVAVLNPHGNAAGWQGMQLIGAGKNYSAVEIFMERYLELIKERYQAFETANVTEDEFLEELLRAGKVSTTICEELSGWSTNVDQTLLHEFIRTALTESRKVGMPMILVAHDPSLEFVGLKKGARLRDKGVLVVEMEPGAANLETGILKATGKGKLQLPGQKDAIAFVFNQPTMEQVKAEGIEAPAVSENLFTPIPAPVASENLTQAIAPPTISENLVQPIPESTVLSKQQLEEAYKLNYAEPTKIIEVEPTAIDYSEAHEFLHSLIQYSLKHGWVSARSIKQNVRSYSQNTADEIREFFIRAAETVGTTRGVDNNLQYAALPGETREKC